MGAMVLCLALALAARADTLHMKDGRVLQGRYLGGTQASIRFEINGEVKTFAVVDVASVTFTRGSAAPAQNGSSPDAPAPDANTPPPPAPANPPDAAAAPPPPPTNAAPDSQPPIVSQDIPPGANPNPDAASAPPPANAPAPPAAPAPAPAPVVAPPAGPPAQPPAAPGSSAQITIPAGQSLLVRMIDGVDSSKNQVGDVFRASLETDFYVGGVFIARKGTDVYGKLAEAQEAGKFSGRSELELQLTRIVIDGRDYPLASSDYTVKGDNRSTDTAKKVGGGAIIGAILGGIVGGGKGAAIGAGAGGATGATVQVLTRGEKVKVPSETLLEFRLQAPATVVPTQR
jgi:hypothetical protein